jgi:hypothetical protein
MINNPSTVIVPANTATQSELSVTSTASEILPANPDRIGAVIVNAGTAPIYLGFGAAPTIASGIYVAAKGSYTINLSLLFAGAVFAIAASAQSVRIVEFSFAYA